MVEFHGKTESIDQDHGKNSIFKDWRGHKSPKFVLNGIFRDVPSYWFGIQGKFDTISLQKKKERKKESKYIFVPAPPRTFLLEMSSDIVLCVYELTHSGRKEGYYYKEGKTPLNSFKSTYPS